MTAETVVELQPVQTPDTWIVDPNALERTRQQAVSERLQRLQTLLPNFQLDSQNEFAAAQDSAKENAERFDDRQGRLVARLVSSVQGRHPSVSLRDRTLRELGNPDNGYRIGHPRVLSETVARLEDHLTRRTPAADSLVYGMRRPILLHEFPTSNASHRSALISAR